MPWVAEMKYDGSSISLIYEEGVLVRAVTRGDGTLGDDVTVNVRTIQSVPLRLRPVAGHPDYTTGRIEVRGEVLLPFKEFERLNGERAAEGEAPFANPRNAAAGTLKTLNSRVVAQRRLLCICYYLYALDDETRLPDSYYERMQLLKEMGFDTGVAPFRSSDLSALYHYIDEWDVQRGDLPYATDGIVLKVDSLTPVSYTHLHEVVHKLCDLTISKYGIGQYLPLFRLSLSHYFVILYYCLVVLFGLPS